MWGSPLLCALAATAIDWLMFHAVHSVGLVMWDIGFFFTCCSSPFIVCISCGFSGREPTRTLSFHLVLDDFEGQEMEGGLGALWQNPQGLWNDVGAMKASRCYSENETIIKCSFIKPVINPPQNIKTLFFSKTTEKKIHYLYFLFIFPIIWLLTTLFNPFNAFIWLKTFNQTSWIHETLSEAMRDHCFMLECWIQITAKLQWFTSSSSLLFKWVKIIIVKWFIYSLLCTSWTIYEYNGQHFNHLCFDKWSFNLWFPNIDLLRNLDFRTIFKSSFWSNVW